MYKYNDLVKLFDVKNFKYGIEYFYIIVIRFTEYTINIIVVADKWLHNCKLAKKIIWSGLLSGACYFADFKNCMTYIFIWLMVDIFRLIGKNTMPLISALLAMYAIFYNTLNRNYSAREAAIINITNKATEQIKDLKDASIARKITHTELVKKPSYLKIYDILNYRSHMSDKVDDPLSIDFDFLKKEITVEISDIPQNINKYTNYTGDVDWLKVYQDVDRNGIALNMIKDYIEGMKKRGFVNEQQQTLIKNEIEREINHIDSFSLNQRLNSVKYRLTLDNQILRGDLKDLWLHGINLENANLQLCDFWRSYLQVANLSRSNLQLSKFWQTNLQGADLSSSNLQGSTISQSNLKGTDMLDANLTGAKLYRNNIEGADLSDANLSKTKLWHSTFTASNLTKANFEYADLSNVKFKKYHSSDKGSTPLYNNISYANFTNSVISNKQKNKAILLKKVFLTSKYEYAMPDFSGVKGIETACFDEGVKEAIIKKFNLSVDEKLLNSGKARCELIRRLHSSNTLKNFSNTTLYNATLQDMSFYGSDFKNSTFYNVKMKNIKFLPTPNGEKTDISNTNFINIFSSKSDGYRTLLVVLQDDAYKNVRPDFSGVKGIETACFDEGVKDEILRQFKLVVDREVMRKNEERCQSIRKELRSRN